MDRHEPNTFDALQHAGSCRCQEQCCKDRSGGGHRQIVVQVKIEGPGLNDCGEGADADNGGPKGDRGGELHVAQGLEEAQQPAQREEECR